MQQEKNWANLSAEAPSPDEQVAPVAPVTRGRSIVKSALATRDASRTTPPPHTVTTPAPFRNPVQLSPPTQKPPAPPQQDTTATSSTSAAPKPKPRDCGFTGIRKTVLASQPANPPDTEEGTHDVFNLGIVTDSRFRNKRSNIPELVTGYTGRSDLAGNCTACSTHSSQPHIS